MKVSMFFVCAVLSIAIGSCGTTSSGLPGTSESDLTSAEISSINTTLMGAVNAAGASSTQTASPNLLEAAPMDAITFTSTCGDSNTGYKFTGTVNNTYACPTAGHITYTGNLKTYCSSWTYTTYNGVNYCTCKGDWYMQNALTFQYGDRTNNLYDCESSGLIVDGTVNVNSSGKVNDFTISITGTLSANRRGSSGGLVPLNSCSIYMYYYSSTGTWSGTLCGRSVS